jgi:hypothetical protein
MTNGGAAHGFLSFGFRHSFVIRASTFVILRSVSNRKDPPLTAIIIAPAGNLSYHKSVVVSQAMAIDPRV